jgi:DMSO/TMAO reductase YedYZ molybdopterin-dependent catalytic subunit
VIFYSFAHGFGEHAVLYYDAHKIEHMYHDNSILAYEMNGKPLSELHGAPLRLRNELELGFKQVKWLQAVEFVETFKQLGSGEGGFNEDNEYFGYRAPI